MYDVYIRTWYAYAQRQSSANTLSAIKGATFIFYDNVKKPCC